MRGERRKMLDVIKREEKEGAGKEEEERKGKMQEKGPCKGESLRLFSTHAMPYTYHALHNNHCCCDWLEVACVAGTPLLIYLTLSLPTHGTI